MFVRTLIAALALFASLGAHAQSSSTLLGEYRFDASSTQVVDSSGAARDGSYIPPGSVAWSNAAPARPGTTGTCGYATFASAGSAAIPGLPVSTAPGDRTSVSFWMYWDGTDNMMPIGWDRYDLWLYSGAFGFNTGNSDVFGVSSAGLAGAWHHVVAVFNNGDYNENKLYIDGAARTLSQQLSSQFTPNAQVQSTMVIGGWSYNSGYLFSGRIDEVSVYDGELSPAQVAALYTAVRDCTPPAPTEVPVLAPVVLAGLALLVGLGGLFGLRRR